MQSATTITKNKHTEIENLIMMISINGNNNRREEAKDREFMSQGTSPVLGGTAELRVEQGVQCEQLINRSPRKQHQRAGGTSKGSREESLERQEPVK